MKKIILAVSLLTGMLLGESSFEVDGIYAGMSGKEFAEKKLVDKNGNRKKNVRSGDMDMASSIIYGPMLSGKFLSYPTKILDKDATVAVFYTKKSLKVYGVIVEWDGLSMDGGGDLYRVVEKSLDKKYGKGKYIDKNEFPGAGLGGKKWMPNDRATIYSFKTFNQSMGLKPIIVYVDAKYSQKNKDELKPAESTNKL